MPLTNSEAAALRAVYDGHVIREYRANGNVLKGPKGVSSAVLWRLDGKKLIADGNDTKRGFVTTCRQIVTLAGQEALALASKR